MFKMFNNRKGFSLVELIVVIVILGVLIGIAAPNLFKYVQDARISKDIAGAEIIRTAVKFAIVDNKLPTATLPLPLDEEEVTNTELADIIKPYIDAEIIPVPEAVKNQQFSVSADAKGLVEVFVGGKQLTPVKDATYGQ